MFFFWWNGYSSHHISLTITSVHHFLILLSYFLVFLCTINKGKEPPLMCVCCIAYEDYDFPFSCFPAMLLKQLFPLLCQCLAASLSPNKHWPGPLEKAIVLQGILPASSARGQIKGSNCPSPMKYVLSGHNHLRIWIIYAKLCSTASRLFLVIFYVVPQIECFVKSGHSWQ